MDTHVDTADLLARLAIPIPSVVTPQMFTYQLMDRARADRKHIVLPEGEDDRILQAAGRLLQRGVAELTILGEEPAVRRRAAELGVDLSAAGVLNPRTSELCDRFAEQYAELRKHKGMTVEQAREDHSRHLVFRHHAGARRTWSTAWCRVQRTPPRIPSGPRSRSSRRRPRCLRCRASS